MKIGKHEKYLWFPFQDKVGNKWPNDVTAVLD